MTIFLALVVMLLNKYLTPSLNDVIHEQALTWKTVSKALVIVSKFEVGLPSGKLNDPPKTCMPRRAKMKMKRKRRKRRDMIEEMAFIRAITRFRSEDQYLKKKI